MDVIEFAQTQITRPRRHASTEPFVIRISFAKNGNDRGGVWWAVASNDELVCCHWQMSSPYNVNNQKSCSSVCTNRLNLLNYFLIIKALYAMYCNNKIIVTRWAAPSTFRKKLETPNSNDRIITLVIMSARGFELPKIIAASWFSLAKNYDVICTSAWG